MNCLAALGPWRCSSATVDRRRDLRTSAHTCNPRERVHSSQGPLPSQACKPLRLRLALRVPRRLLNALDGSSATIRHTQVASQAIRQGAVHGPRSSRGSQPFQWFKLKAQHAYLSTLLSGELLGIGASMTRYLHDIETWLFTASSAAKLGSA